MVGWHKDIFDHAAWENHKSSSGFRNNWLNPEFRRFYEEGVYNHFTITFGFVFLIQLFIIVIFIIVKLFYIAAKKRT